MSDEIKDTEGIQPESTTEPAADPAPAAKTYTEEEYAALQDQLKTANDTIQSYKDMDIDGIKEYIPFTGYKGGITISASSFSGKKMQVYLFCFKGNTFVAASSWNDSPYTYDKKTTDFDNIKVIVRYATQETIYPEDIQSVTVDAPFTWTYKDGVPLPIANQNLPTDYTFPSARWTWRYSSDSIPCNGFMPISEPPEPKGAFRNCASLERVYIPESVKYIGKEAFAGTALKTVKIAADCEYSPTSFPDGCIVEFYGGGGDYGQLYDYDGYAVLDSEAARIYVRSDKHG